MFRRIGRTQTEHRQLSDESGIDEIISDKIRLVKGKTVVV